MSDSFSYVDPTPNSGDPGGDPTGTVDKVGRSTNALGISATAFANAITKAFAQATMGGKQFDDVLKSLALRMSNLTVQAALKPLAKDAAKGFNGILNAILGTGGTGGATGTGPVLTAFASGGVIGSPSYFPLSNGGLGLAGEAGPEAILPLSRGSDGSLGVSVAGGAAPANVTVQIATPDAQSFRRSEAYITGQIARAVARGQRSL
jgi:phage-related minor tail protein